MRSPKSFSQPYPSSGIAGYASDSRNGTTSGEVCRSAAYTQADDEKKKRSTPASRAAISMCVLMSTDSMHSALWSSMNPIPPMSAARLKIARAPFADTSHAARSLRSRTQFSTSSNTLIPLIERLDVDGADAGDGYGGAALQRDDRR